MNPVYIFKKGFLRRKDNTIILESEDGKRSVPIKNLSEIKVFSEIDINKRALEFLGQNQIPVHFYNRYGHYAGSFYPYEYNSNGCTILNQVKTYIDPDKREDLAKRFVSGSMDNMIQVLQYYKRKEKEVSEKIDYLKEIRDSLPKAGGINEIMAKEGNFRETYYSCFDAIIENEEFTFDCRTRRPPKNYLNTMISFGNGLMYSTALTEIYKTPLDPRIGFLHSTNFRRFSLNLDIAEIFKPVIVDRTIFQLINRKQISEKHFKGVEGGIHLNDEGKKIYISVFEEHLNSTIMNEKLKRKISYRSLIRHECYKIIKHLMADKEYEPFYMR